MVEIGHLRRHYLPPSETFIHTFLARARRFKPYVFTEVLANHGRFPAPCSYLIEQRRLKRLQREMGGRFRDFKRTFFGQLDYPNCFERSIHQRDIRLLHAHFGTEGCSALRLKQRMGLPLVTSFHGFDASRMLRHRRWREPLKRLFGEGDAFTVVSKDMATRLAEFGCPRHKIRVQHVGIEVDRIPYPSGPAPRDPHTVLLFCGRLIEKKGVLHVLLAFARLADKWPDLVLRIVGDGPLRQELNDTISRLRLDDRVSLLGMVSHECVLHEMQHAHIFMLPSVTAADGDMEGAPVVLMEAQAAGLPVISTHHADIPEVVLDGRSGFLVPEHDNAGLVDRADFLLSHPDRWSKFGAAGRRHIEGNYNITTQVESAEELYEELIGP